MRIENESLLRGLAQTTPTPKNATPQGDFGGMLMDALKEVNASQQNSRAMQNAFMAGQPGVEVHDLMIAMERSSTAMQLTLQVRNKMLEAYQEMVRMQI
jgi:flagellar hook-basal body complex protein FliE